MHPTIQNNTTILDTVTAKPDTRDIFERFSKLEDIQYYTIKELSYLKDIDADFLIFLLDAFDSPSLHRLKQIDLLPSSISISKVINYLKITHQDYLQRRIRKIESHLLKIRKSLFPDHLAIIELMESLYLDFKKDLVRHIRKEEKELFPILEADNVALKFQTIEQFVGDHKNEEEHTFFSVLKLINPYSLNVCESYHVIRFEEELMRFKKDLTVHAWVEEELIPFLIFE